MHGSIQTTCHKTCHNAKTQRLFSPLSKHTKGPYSHPSTFYSPFTAKHNWTGGLIIQCVSYSHPIPLTFQTVYLEPEGVRHLVFNGCYSTLPQSRAVPSSLPERGGYCFPDRDQWMGECALILQELLSQANKCKPPC